MPSKLITSIAVALILSFAIVPSPLFAADDDLLTLKERYFRSYMGSQIAQARDVVGEWRGVVGSKWHMQDANPYGFGTGQFPTIQDCHISSTGWPDTVSEITLAWNTEVCREFGYINQKAESIEESVNNYKPVVTIVDFTTGVFMIRGALARIESSLSKIEGMIADRMDELIKLRKTAKEVEKEAKKELNLGDDFCFIATAAYGTPTAKEIDELRRFRDEYLRKSYLGNEFIRLYYENSPPIAKFISEHEILRVMVREGFVEPVVKIVELTENYWSE